MAALGGVAVLGIFFAFGMGMAFSAIIGFILCALYKKKTGRKAKLWIRILLWIALITGIVIVVIPSMYFYLIAVNWNRV